MVDWEKLRNEVQLMIITYKDLLSVPKRDKHVLSCVMNNELFQIVRYYSANLGISISTFIKLSIIRFLEELGYLEKRDAKLKLRKVIEEIIEGCLRKRCKSITLE